MVAGEGEAPAAVRMLEGVSEAEGRHRLGRREANHRPQGRDVAGSRDPLKGCKVCLGLYRPAVYEKGVDERAGEILVLKNNQGPSGLTVNVRLDLATHTIRDA